VDQRRYSIARSHERLARNSVSCMWHMHAKVAYVQHVNTKVAYVQHVNTKLGTGLEFSFYRVMLVEWSIQNSNTAGTEG
jgi:hypothetical protein